MALEPIPLPLIESNYTLTLNPSKIGSKSKLMSAWLSKLLVHPTVIIIYQFIRYLFGISLSLSGICLPTATLAEEYVNVLGHFFTLFMIETV